MTRPSRKEKTIIYPGLPSAQDSAIPRPADEVLLAYEFLTSRQRTERLRTTGRLLLALLLLLTIPSVAMLAHWGITTAFNPSLAPTMREFIAAILIGNALALPISLTLHRQSRATYLLSLLADRPAVIPPNKPSAFFVSIILNIIAGGMLLASFTALDATRRLTLFCKVRSVDLQRLAPILARLLHAKSQGIDPRPLQLIGEPRETYLRHLAYLLIYEWADLSPHGNHLTLIHPKHRLSLRGVLG